MLEKNNADLAVCVRNLLKTQKDEVAYRRQKGIPHDTTDLPADEIEQQMVEDAELCIYSYEPRIKINDVSVNVANKNGNFEYIVNISKKL